MSLAFRMRFVGEFYDTDTGEVRVHYDYVAGSPPTVEVPAITSDITRPIAETAPAIRQLRTLYLPALPQLGLRTGAEADATEDSQWELVRGKIRFTYALAGINTPDLRWRLIYDTVTGTLTTKRRAAATVLATDFARVPDLLCKFLDRIDKRYGA